MTTNFKSTSVGGWRYPTRLSSNIDQNMDGYPPKFEGSLSEKLGLKEYSEEAYLKAGDGIYKLPDESRYTDLNHHKNRVKTSRSRTMIAGHQVVYSPPKSFSVAYAYAKDQKTKELIMEVILAGYKKVMEQTEKKCGVMVERKGVRQFVPSPQISYTTFTHNFSREGDANIHFHAMINRAVYNPITNELQGSGLDTQRAREAELEINAEGNRALIEAAYAAGLAITLRQSLNRHGQVEMVPELAGVPQALIEGHSNSSKRIERELQSRGQSLKTASTQAITTANQVTRPKKQARSEIEIEQRNQDILEECGLARDYDLDVYSGIKQGTKNVRESAAVTNNWIGYTHYQTPSEAVDAGIAHLTASEAVIRSVPDLVASTMKNCNYVYSSDEIQKAIDEKLESKELLFRFPELAANASYFCDKGKRREEAMSLTTSMIVQQERDTIRLYKQGLDRREPMSTPGAVKKAIADMEAVFKANLTAEEIASGKGKLSQGQQDMVLSIMLARDSTLAIEGWAGTGKTTAGQTIQNIANESRISQSTKNVIEVCLALEEMATPEKPINVVGIAPSNASRIALKEAGVHTNTLQSLVKNGAIIAKNWKDVGKNTIILADESSMWSTVDFNAIMAESQRRGALAVFIGDRDQLQSVQRGGPFRQICDLAEELGRKVELNEQQRSKTEESRVAHYYARKDQIEALNYLKEQDAVFEGNISEQYAHLVKEFENMGSDEERFATPIIVDTHKDRIAITKAIRSALYQDDVTVRTQEVIKMTEVELHNYINYEPDYIVTIRNRSPQFFAQEKLRVLSIEKNIVIVQREDGTTANFDPSKYGFNVQSIGFESKMSTSIGEPVRFNNGITSLENLKIINGARARVMDIDHKKKVMHLHLVSWDGKDGDKFSISFANKKELLPITNGFASTVHSLQAASIEKGYYLMSVGTSREAFHVAVTRFKGRDGQWLTGIKLVTSEINEDLKQAVTRSVAKLEALPVEKGERVIKKSNALVLPSAAEDPLESFKKAIRVPYVAEKNEDIILDKLLEYKETYGDKVHVAGSPEFMQLLKIISEANNVQVEFVNEPGLALKVETPQVQEQESDVAVSVTGPESHQHAEAEIEVKQEQEVGLDLGF